MSVIDQEALLPCVSMDLLQAFVVTADEGSMTAAARRLFLSTSGVSRRIRTLESELGGAVFARTSRAMYLTPTGAAFLPHARAILGAMAVAVHALREPQSMAFDDVVLGGQPRPGAPA